MVVRWGIIGPGSIAKNFADGLKEAPQGRLEAIASRDAGRRQGFGDAYGIDAALRFDDYAALAASEAVDAIYIATPHPFHAELSVLALTLGKAVLCEKPAGMSAAEVIAVTEVAARQERLFLEAYMYRCHPQIARVIEILRAGEIGAVTHVRAMFGFAARINPASRLFNHDLGGGGILDVGGYPLSLVRLIAGVAQGGSVAEPLTLRGTGLLGETGVDQVALASLTFPGGITAEIGVSVVRAMDNRAVIEGTEGRIVIEDPWVPGRNAGPSDAVLTITAKGVTRTETLRHPEQLFAFEARVASTAIAEGRGEAPFPAMSHADSIGNAHALDRWRAELGYRTVAETPKGNRRLGGLMPRDLPPMPRVTLPGLDQSLSPLILGCDNRNTLSEGAVIWDAWMEAGGNAFDTAFVYGGGLHERVLGDWIKARGVADQVRLIAKGAHSPWCIPDAIEIQLTQSLERLGVEHAPIYILHRDNPAVPAGEFVDALNALKAKGRIGIFGGSNWSPARLAEANAHAARTGQEPMRILNNNLSLAVMEKPVWAGCVTSNTPETLAFLRDSGTVHLSWSSQARGYFLPEALRNRLPADTAPETCFGSPANAERRKRAETIAAEQGTTANAIATAWVLGQGFPSLALIGPRSPGEIASTMAALKVQLSADDLAWLNLERDAR